MTQQQKFEHIERMQVRVMAKDSYIDQDQWNAVTEDEQNKYYTWMCGQVGEHCDLI